MEREGKWEGHVWMVLGRNGKEVTWDGVGEAGNGMGQHDERVWEADVGVVKEGRGREWKGQDSRCVEGGRRTRWNGVGHSGVGLQEGIVE